MKQNKLGNYVFVTNDPGRGVYSSTGATRVTIVTGAVFTGLYAADGSLNIVVSSLGFGYYHPCGAIRVTPATGQIGFQAPDGSIYAEGILAALIMLNTYSPTDGLVFNTKDNSLVIRDSVTPANNYLGPLIAADGTMNKFTFTRASSATFVNSTGVVQTAVSNKPRIDYSQGYGALLMEGAATNLFTESECRNGLADTSPNGGLVSGTIFSGLTQSTGIAFGHDGVATSFAYKQTTLTVATYTISVFVRMTDGLAPVFGSSTAINVANDFAFVFEGNAIAPNLSSVSSIGSGLYRVTVPVANLAAALSNYGVVKYSTNSARTFTVSGYQLELGSIATSYIPTTTATVTRAVDACSILDTLFNLVDATGTLFVEGSTAIPTADAIVRFAALLNDTTTYTNAIRLERLSGADREIKTVAGVAAVNSVGAWPVNTRKKLALAYANANSASSVAGSVAASIAGANPTGMAYLSVGGNAVGGNSWQGHITTVAYFGVRITDTQVQVLTT